MHYLDSLGRPKQRSCIIQTVSGALNSARALSRRAAGTLGTHYLHVQERPICAAVSGALNSARALSRRAAGTLGTHYLHVQELGTHYLHYLDVQRAHPICTTPRVGQCYPTGTPHLYYPT